MPRGWEVPAAYSVIEPAVVHLTILSFPAQVNHRFVPSEQMSHGFVPVGTLYSVIVPPDVTLQTLFWLYSVNQTLLSGPRTAPRRPAEAVRPEEYSVIVPAMTQVSSQRQVIVSADFVPADALDVTSS